MTRADWPHPFGFTQMPRLPAAAPRRNGGVGRWIGRAVMRLLGWRLVGPYPDVPRLVVIGAPHTSNWDGIVGFAAILALDLDLRVMVKDAHFTGVRGRILRSIRAIPIDRSVRGGVTEQMVQRFAREERFVLGVAPEGTRKKVDRWRTGFYRIAEGAGVPILTVALDFATREVRLGPTIIPSGDMEADIGRMQAFVATARARNPANA
jgi:1-acyl-sn-glycerol-3-phosphate acyltransferase